MSVTDMDSHEPYENHAQLNSSSGDSTSPIIQNRNEAFEQTMNDIDVTSNEDAATEESSEEEEILEKAKRPKISELHDGKSDMEKMYLSVAHWIMMHEHPFSIVEEEGFNSIQRLLNPGWTGISKIKAKSYCVNIYDMEKKRLKALLKDVNRISLSIDSWKSEKNQKVEYMVLIGHWIDQNWHLQKRVLNFLDIEPFCGGLEIANAIWRCLEEWGIESKVHTISVDNNSANDSVIDILKVHVEKRKKLLSLGNIFHVRCFAHALNLMAQDGLFEIKDIINVVRDSVEYVRQSDEGIEIFSEIVKQLNLPDRKLIDDFESEWNSTYEMLTCAIKFKDAFFRLVERDPYYETCPSEEDWAKVEKVCSVLKVFLEAMKTATHIISGSDYPTSNLFLFEASEVKEVLDKKSSESDDFIRNMVEKMKVKFDKYWEDSNMLMSIAIVLDPRCKMSALNFRFTKLYILGKAEREMAHVRKVLYEIYSEYESMYNVEQASSREQEETRDSKSLYGWSTYGEYLRDLESIQPQKSELDMYLEERCNVADIEKGRDYDVLEWWKIHSCKYKILSKMARDILSIPVTTVASDATFSAGSRVINEHHASLTSNTAQVLICGGDWLRKHFGVKNNSESDKEALEVILPIDDEVSKDDPSC